MINLANFGMGTGMGTTVNRSAPSIAPKIPLPANYEGMGQGGYNRQAQLMAQGARGDNLLGNMIDRSPMMQRLLSPEQQSVYRTVAQMPAASPLMGQSQQPAAPFVQYQQPVQQQLPPGMTAEQMAAIQQALASLSLGNFGMGIPLGF